jgi:hypothetical protein
MTITRFSQLLYIILDLRVRIYSFLQVYRMLEINIVVLDDGTDSTPEPIRERVHIARSLGSP